jgi:cardiolipin synthase
MDLRTNLDATWHYLVAALTVLVAVLGSAHAVLYKRDSRAAVLWVGFIWLVPLMGAILYLLLGVNRIRRHAVSIRRSVERYQALAHAPSQSVSELTDRIPAEKAHLAPLARLGNKIVQRPLAPGNSVEPLVDGDMAYPAMLAAITQARETINLSTYIFDNDRAGRMFASALGDAVRRGVDVRVIIDDAGARYSWPSITGALRREGIRVVRFLPTFSLWRSMFLNLRTHRKILIVDGRVGFTGGMNIRAGHVLKDQAQDSVRDLHFRLEGPVVAQFQAVFVEDWCFCTQELLRGSKWFPVLEEKGDVTARGISDGPDEDFEILRLVILGALSSAQSSVRIMTPYFLPDQSLISALNVAAMRGVEVDIILPSQSNLPYIQWASRAIWWQMLERGCRIWLTPPPFDHSKLMLVDECWSLMGSANWDPRSLRLNFEFNVECYDCKLSDSLASHVRAKLEGARQVSLQEMDRRPLPARLRDGIARLFTPFL